MASRVELTPIAWDDLDIVFSTVLEVLGDVRVAERTYKEVLDAIERVIPLPAACPSVMSRTGIPCDYRWIQQAGWLVFFHIDGELVLVDRVLWGRSDWLRALGLK